MKNFNFPLDYPIEKLPEKVTEITEVEDEKGNTVRYVAAAEGMHHVRGSVFGTIIFKKMQLEKRPCIFSWLQKSKTVWKLAWSLTADSLICGSDGGITALRDNVAEDIIAKGKNAGIGLSPELIDITLKKVEEKVREECRKCSGIRISVAC